MRLPRPFRRFGLLLLAPMMVIIVGYYYAIAYLRYWLTPREPLPQSAGTVTASHSHMAIVALHQVGVLCRNCEQMLTELAARGVGLIVINNGALRESEARRIQGFALMYHERKPGLGRDFASYKLGVRIIQHMIERGAADPKRIIFANDSVLVLRARYRAFLERFLAEAAPVVGVTETTERNYHISSWLFSVSRDVWEQPFFKRYWARLRPIHCRPHTIRAGELRFSAMLTYNKVPISLMYPASVFIKALAQLPQTNIEETLQYLPYGFLRAEPGVLAAEKFKDVRWTLLAAQHGINQTAFWQLAGLLHVDFPFVKKDVYYRGVFSLTQMRLFFDAFNGLPEADKQYIMDKVMAVRDPHTFRPLEKLRYLAGLE